MLRVKDVEPVAVMDIHPWNVNIVEECFATVPEMTGLTFRAQTEEDAKLLPKIPSSPRDVLIFAP